MTSSILVR